MRNLVPGNQFKRDVKLAQKRHKDMSKLRKLLDSLVAGVTLPSHYRDHALSGNWKHHRDAHIEPDWLLLYKVAGDDVHLVRTGSHADLF